MITTERNRTISAHPTRVWDVLADFDRLAVWADDADHTCWLDDPPDDGDMVGRARRVQAGRVVLVERITVWEPPARLADHRAAQVAVDARRHEMSTESSEGVPQ